MKRVEEKVSAERAQMAKDRAAQRPPSAGKPKSNPFGAAKPVDQKDAWQKVEDKVSKEKARLAAVVHQEGPEDGGKKPQQGNKSKPEGKGGKGGKTGGAAAAAAAEPLSPESAKENKAH